MGKGPTPFCPNLLLRIIPLRIISWHHYCLVNGCWKWHTWPVYFLSYNYMMCFQTCLRLGVSGNPVWDRDLSDASCREVRKSRLVEDWQCTWGLVDPIRHIGRVERSLCPCINQSLAVVAPWKGSWLHGQRQLLGSYQQPILAANGEMRRRCWSSTQLKSTGAPPKIPRKTWMRNSDRHWAMDGWLYFFYIQSCFFS